MGRWKYDEHGWLQAESQEESIESIDEAMRFHHADVDAYEARIAELEAELARVKAESLRVVPVGEAIRVGWNPIPAVVVLGSQIFWIDNNEGLTGTHWCYDMARGGSAFGTINDDTIVQPVRLERWEDEE